MRTFLISAAILVFGIGLFLVGNRLPDWLGLDRLESTATELPVIDPRAADLPSPEVPGDAASHRVLQLFARLNVRGAIPDEALLRFVSEKAYRDFLASLAGSSLSKLGQMDAWRTVRVRFPTYGALADALDGRDAEAEPNYLVYVPGVPGPGDGGIQAGAVGFGNSALSWLGVAGDHSTWGAGQTIAVLDTGVSSHISLEGSNITSVNLLGDGIDFNNHGTAVASLAAGNHPSLSGVAPSAALLDIRVADADGVSNSFVLAEGIVTAADRYADVINVSLGSTGDSYLVREAVAYAQEKGSVVVAASGNNGTDYLAFPAGYEGVVAVGSVDASGDHLDFSNAGEGMDITAPGLELVAAYGEAEVINFTGTSASTPLVSGAIAALLSTDPSMTGQEAIGLLQDYGNEAGPPGYDAYYGSGVLDVGRVMQRNEPGITDLAVASHYYAPDPVHEELRNLQVVVENQGTQAVTQAVLHVETPTGKRVFALPPIQPNEVVYRSVIADSFRAAAENGVTYNSWIEVPGTTGDVNPNNNRLQSVWTNP